LASIYKTRTKQKLAVFTAVTFITQVLSMEIWWLIFDMWYVPGGCRQTAGVPGGSR